MHRVHGGVVARPRVAGVMPTTVPARTAAEADACCQAVSTGVAGGAKSGQNQCVRTDAFVVCSTPRGLSQVTIHIAAAGDSIDWRMGNRRLPRGGRISTTS